MSVNAAEREHEPAASVFDLRRDAKLLQLWNIDVWASPLGLGGREIWYKQAANEDGKFTSLMCDVLRLRVFFKESNKS